MEMEQLTQQIVAAAIEVHRELGPGLLESSYLRRLCHELALPSVPSVCEQQPPVTYKRLRLDCGSCVDLTVADAVVVEVKAVERLERIHEAQLITYLRLGGWKIGLLMNFNVSMLKNGIKRRVVGASS